jgi:peptidoglycan/xylan/chitin deacetylase (PgdA/CDA1 family)
VNLTILNFHGLGPVPRAIDSGEEHCWLPQNTFESILDLVTGQPHVHLTFDDGNASDATIALPALQRRKLTACFFLCSGRIGRPSFLNHHQVQSIQAAGMEIGSHGINHESWRKLSSAQLASEVSASRSDLEELCGMSVESAACPYGAYNRRVLLALKRTGYRAVYTSDGGTTRSDRWLKARTTITRAMTVDEVSRLITFGPSRRRQFLISLRMFCKRFR